MLDRSLICAACFASALFAAPTAAQVVDYSKYPAFKGQWFRTGPPNNWRQVAGLPPYTPEAQKKWEAIQNDLKNGGPGNWPSTYCIPTGMPAMMNLYNPMEIVITPEITYILMSHNSDNFRRIYTDGRNFPAEGTVDPTFAGYSIGKWIDEDGMTCSKLRRATCASRAPMTSAACRSPTTARPSSRSVSIWRRVTPTFSGTTSP